MADIYFILKKKKQFTIQFSFLLRVSVVFGSRKWHYMTSFKIFNIFWSKLLLKLKKYENKTKKTPVL